MKLGQAIIEGFSPEIDEWLQVVPSQYGGFVVQQSQSGLWEEIASFATEREALDFFHQFRFSKKTSPLARKANEEGFRIEFGSERDGYWVTLMIGTFNAREEAIDALIQFFAGGNGGDLGGPLRVVPESTPSYQGFRGGRSDRNIVGEGDWIDFANREWGLKLSDGRVIREGKKATPGNDQNGQGDSSLDHVEVEDEQAKDTMFPWEDTGEAGPVKHSKISWLDMKRNAYFDGGALARLVGERLPQANVSWEGLGGNVMGLVIESNGRTYYVSDVAGEVGIGSEDGEFYQSFDGLDFVEDHMRDIVEAVVTVASSKLATRSVRQITAVWNQGVRKISEFEDYSDMELGTLYADVARSLKDGWINYEEIPSTEALLDRIEEELEARDHPKFAVTLDPDRDPEEDEIADDANAPGRVEVDVRTARSAGRRISGWGSFGGQPWDAQPWGDAQYNDDYSVVPGTSALQKALESYIPAMTSPDGKALADFVYSIDADSVNREIAFSWASQIHGWDYDDLYNSWLNTASRKNADAANDPEDVEVGDEDDLPMDNLVDDGEVFYVPSSGPYGRYVDKNNMPVQTYVTRRHADAANNPSDPEDVEVGDEDDIPMWPLDEGEEGFLENDQTEESEFTASKRKRARKQAGFVTEDHFICHECGYDTTNEYELDWIDNYGQCYECDEGIMEKTDEDKAYLESMGSAEMPGESQWVGDSWPHDGGTSRPEVENPVDMFDAQWVQRPEESESLQALAVSEGDLVFYQGEVGEVGGLTINMEGVPSAYFITEPAAPYGGTGHPYQDGIWVPQSELQPVEASKTATTRNTLADPNVWKKLEALPAIYATDGTKGDRPAVRLFNPYGAGSWIIWEYDPSTQEGFGWADLGYGEMGYISVAELASLTFMGQAGLAIERDTSVSTMFEGFQASGTPLPSTVAKRAYYNDDDIAMMELADSANAGAATMGRTPFDPALHGKYVEDATLDALWGMYSVYDAVVQAADDYDFAADDNAHAHSFEYSQGRGKRDIERMERGGSLGIGSDEDLFL